MDDLSSNLTPESNDLSDWMCQAKRCDGQPCRKAGIQPSGRCRLHGGASPRGMAHPSFKTGRYSRFLPARLAARYEEALADPELLSNRSDIALLEVRIADLIEQLAGDRDPRCVALIAALKDSPRSAAVEEAKKAIKAMIGSDERKRAIWRQLTKVLTTRARLVTLEHRRMKDLRQMIPIEQAALLVSTIVKSVRTHVNDESKMHLIAADVGRLINRRIDEKTGCIVKSNE